MGRIHVKTWFYIFVLGLQVLGKNFGPTINLKKQKNCTSLFGTFARNMGHSCYAAPETAKTSLLCAVLHMLHIIYAFFKKNYKAIKKI